MEQKEQAEILERIRVALANKSIDDPELQLVAHAARVLEHLYKVPAKKREKTERPFTFKVDLSDFIDKLNKTGDDSVVKPLLVKLLTAELINSLESYNQQLKSIHGTSATPVIKDIVDELRSNHLEIITELTEDLSAIIIERQQSGLGVNAPAAVAHVPISKVVSDYDGSRGVAK